VSRSQGFAVLGCSAFVVNFRFELSSYKTRLLRRSVQS
jgi:hypothetical protein